jgi:chemotaxis family two-component system response regulator Rcp1
VPVMQERTHHILIVEDNPGDVRLIIEALAELPFRTESHVAADGQQALDYLQRRGDYEEAPRPDLVLLDLNLPKLSGREVLARVKQDPALRRIPVTVLTSSAAEEDVMNSYDLHANCYVTKPMRYERFMSVLTAVSEFWLGEGKAVQLPPS